MRRLLTGIVALMVLTGCNSMQFGWKGLDPSDVGFVSVSGTVYQAEGRLCSPLDSIEVSIGFYGEDSGSGPLAQEKIVTGSFGLFYQIFKEIPSTRILVEARDIKKCREGGRLPSPASHEILLSSSSPSYDPASGSFSFSLIDIYFSRQ